MDPLGAQLTYIGSVVQAQAEHDRRAGLGVEVHCKQYGWPDTRYAPRVSIVCQIFELMASSRSGKDRHRFTT